MILDTNVLRSNALPLMPDWACAKPPPSRCEFCSFASKEVASAGVRRRTARCSTRRSSHRTSLVVRRHTSRSHAAGWHSTGLWATERVAHWSWLSWNSTWLVAHRPRLTTWLSHVRRTVRSWCALRPAHRTSGTLGAHGSGTVSTSSTSIHGHAEISTAASHGTTYVLIGITHWAWLILSKKIRFVMA